MTGFRLVTLAATAATSVAVSAATLGNGSLEICFAPPGRGFAITAIVNKVAGDVRFCAAQKSGPDFWMAKFRRGPGEGETAILQNHSPSRRSMRTNPDGGASFLWEGLNLPGASNSVDVVAAVSFAPDGASVWDISVTNRAGNGWALFSTACPYLREVTPTGACDALVPTKELGARLLKRFDPAELQPRSYGYPGWYPMVTAFMRGDAGLYFAAHDREARIKSLEYTKMGDVYFETPVENAGVAGKAASGPKHSVTVAAFRGDWWRAADIYRKFALTCPWTAKGPMAKRADYPRAMSDVDIWCRIGGTTLQNMTKMNAVFRKAWPGVKIGSRWYNWNIQPFDHDYPEFRAQKGVSEHLAWCRDNGILAMPYVNGRIWDAALMSFQYALKDACRKRSGAPQIERYGSEDFAVMCPTAKLWHDVLFRMGTNVIDALGAPAIYYDQISCSRPQLCFDASHGHPAGGGTWWADGYREALTRIHAKFSAANVPITSEGAAETWMDVVDGHLICGREADCNDVPFLPAVYSGYTIFFGTETSFRDDSRAVFARIAEGTVHGVVTGSWKEWRLFRDTSTADAAVTAADIYACAKVRRSAADYLVYGHMEDALRPLDPLPSVQVEWNSSREFKYTKIGKPVPPPHRVEFPAVIGAVWRNVEGSRRAVVAANVSGEAVKVRIHAPAGAVEPRSRELAGQPAPLLSAEGGIVSLTLSPKAFACVEWRTSIPANSGSR